jgi:3-oxoacyl-[acyl-carrier protein] reductase
MNVLVIGGTGTLGSAIVRRFVGEGDDVWFSYNTNLAGAKELMQQSGAEGSFNHTHSTDVLNLDFTVDIYIDASGSNRPNDFDKVSLIDLQAVFDDNIIGPYRTAQQVAPHIVPGGAMVFLSSSSVDTGGPRSVHYAASKAGIEAMVIGLARFMAHKKVRVNGVSPGYIESPMASGATSPAVNKQIDSILLGRLGKPDEIADAVYFAATNSYLNGQVIKVNGGMI